MYDKAIALLTLLLLWGVSAQQVVVIESGNVEMGEPGDSSWGPNRVVEVNKFDIDSHLVTHRQFMVWLNKIDANSMMRYDQNTKWVTHNNDSSPYHG